MSGQKSVVDRQARRIAQHPMRDVPNLLSYAWLHFHVIMVMWFPLSLYDEMWNSLILYKLPLSSNTSIQLKNDESHKETLSTSSSTCFRSSMSMCRQRPKAV